MTGIEYPTITVGEHKDMQVRLTLAAQVLMRRRGIDPARIGVLMQPKEPDAVPNIIAVFSCMVAENFIDPKATRLDLNSAPSADYWATQIEDFAEVEKAVWSALGKAVEERRKKLAAVPPMKAAS